MVVVNKLLLSTCILIISGCASSNNIQMVSSDEFKKEYKNSKIHHTMKSYKLLNIKNGKICLEKEEMSSYNKSKWNKEIICTQIDLLDEDIKNDILKAKGSDPK